MKQIPLPAKLAAPAQRSLAAAKIVSLQTLAYYTEEQVAQLHGIGANAMLALKQALKENGLQFARIPK